MAARLTALIVVAIVTITVIAGLIVGAQRDDGDGPVDLIVYNARVFAADGRAPFDGAVAVRGNEILRVGESREIRRLRRPQTIEVDARGGTLMPGFNDAHLHFVSGGLGLERVNLLDATTVDEITAAIKAFAERHPDRPWVIGRGWYYEPFPGGLPTRELLDAIVPDRPAYMTAYDGHTAWVNTKALELAGVTKKSKAPKNGAIVKDAKTGEPTGVLKETAKGLVSRLLPEPTREDRLRALRAAMSEAHRLGITSMQNAHGDADEFALYDELRKADDLKVRTYSAVSIDAPLTDAQADEIDAIRKKYAEDPVFKTGAVKLMGDGVIESNTAGMLAPYANKPKEKGHPHASDEDLKATVAKVDARGWQVMIHAIGDATIRQALDAYAHAASVNPAPSRGRRHRIEHIETIDPADVPRFAALGVIASMQPFHGNPSQNQIGVWEGTLGPERAARGWSYGSIAKAGGRLAFGSDWPVVTLDPRAGLHMAVNRTTADGRPAGGWHAKERVSLAQALEAYTSGAAYASFDEHRKGRIQKGMLADLVVLSADIFALPAARLLEAKITHTVFDGKIVFERGKDQPPAPRPSTH
jgi:hypothetical protein